MPARQTFPNFYTLTRGQYPGPVQADFVQIDRDRAALATAFDC